MVYQHAFQLLEAHAHLHRWADEFAQELRPQLLAPIVDAMLFGWTPTNHRQYTQWRLELEHRLALEGTELETIWSDPPGYRNVQPLVVGQAHMVYNQVKAFSGVFLAGAIVHARLEHEGTDLVMTASLQYKNTTLVSSIELERCPKLAPDGRTDQTTRFADRMEWLVDSHQLLPSLIPSQRGLHRVRNITVAQAA